MDLNHFGNFDKRVATMQKKAFWAAVIGLILNVLLLAGICVGGYYGITAAYAAIVRDFGGK